MGKRTPGFATLVIGIALAFAPQASAVNFSAVNGLDPIADGTGACTNFGAPTDVHFDVTGINDAPIDAAVTFTPVHPRVGDLEVTLIAPDNTQQTIFSRTGAVFSGNAGDGSSVGGSYTFSDLATGTGWWEAADGTSDASQVPNGTYRATRAGAAGRPSPAKPVSISSAFSTLSNPNGTWTLRFRDGCAGQTGSVAAATLSISQTFRVENTNDSGSGSLRAAITNANASPGLDLIEARSVTGTINLDTALPNVTDAAEIRGPRADQLTVRRNAGPTFRVFSVLAGPTRISDMTIANGSNPAGGGVLTQADLTLYRVAIRDNTGGNGAGLLVNGGATTVYESLVTGNTSPSNGGGIAILGGTLTVDRSTVAGNIGALAGGVFAAGPGLVTIRTSTITGNSTSNVTGAGGIYVSGNPLSLQSSTVAANTAPGAANINVVAGPGATTTSSIVANPLGGGTNCGGLLVSSGGFNLASDASCNLDQSTDQPSTDPLLGPLKDNGGDALTMVPGPTSPAIDQGTYGQSTFDQDQRRFPRVADMPLKANAVGGSGVDVGAVEVGSETIPLPTISFTGGPIGAINNTNRTVEFTATGFAQIDCSITGDDPTAGDSGICFPPGVSLPGDLPDGPWTVHLHAKNIAGAGPSISRSFVVDTKAPAVSVDFGPVGKTTDATPAFGFSSDEKVTFECRISAATPIGPCSGPGQTHTASALPDGEYAFEVRATDAAGNESIAVRSFRLTAAACEAAEQDLARAEKAVAKAEKKLAKAKASGDAKKIKKAKKVLRKAAKAQANAKDRVGQSCVTSDE